MSAQHYIDRKKEAIQRFQSIRDYLEKSTKCRSQMLLEYFGEQNSLRCGKCDVCESRVKTGLSEYKFNEILNIVKPALNESPMPYEKLISLLGTMDSEKAIAAVRWMMDNGKINLDEKGNLSWKK